MTRKQTIKDKVLEALDFHPEGLTVENILKFHDYQINRYSLGATLAVLARTKVVEIVEVRASQRYPDLSNDRLGRPALRPKKYKIYKED